jgi:hypothetical protein
LLSWVKTPSAQEYWAGLRTERAYALGEVYDGLTVAVEEREALGVAVRVTLGVGDFLALGRGGLMALALGFGVFLTFLGFGVFLAGWLRDGDTEAVGVGAGAASAASRCALEATGINASTRAADIHDNGLRVTRDPHLGDFPVRRSSQAIQTHWPY